MIEPTADEMAAHREYLAALDKETKGRCVWFSSKSARAGGIARRGLRLRSVAFRPLS